MNATIQSAPLAVRTYGPADKLKMLLKREFWENRGGFLWAPLITGAIACLFAVIGVIGGTVALQRAKAAGKIDWANSGIVVDGGTAATREAIGGTGDIFFLSGILIALAVMVFVVFFYSLGSLYDERRDRSVLFWKSLPVSDSVTVVSKAIWALLLAPALSIVIGIAIGAVILLLMSVAFALNGIPDASALLLESHLFRILAGALSMLPVYAMWALPTVGWLMLCSAWAKRLPFLWAVLLPILGCAMVSMTAGIANAIAGVEFPHQEMWYVVVFRGLLSIVPMTWSANPDVNAHYAIEINGPQDLYKAIDFTNSWAAFGTLELWIGAAVGIAMIVAAIRLRRWRDEG
jgi:ABC-2 type transport system permease protein